MKTSICIAFIFFFAFSCKKSTKDYYENGNLRSEKISLVNGFMEHRYYYENGQTKFIIQYTNGLKNGKTISYFRNGQVDTQDNFSFGLANGQHTEFYQNGNVKVEAFYNCFQ